MNAEQRGVCPHSSAHLVVFAQSIMEHISAAVPEIILANCTACGKKLPRRTVILVTSGSNGLKQEGRTRSSGEN